MFQVVNLGDKRALYLGPGLDDPRPGMDLRAHVNMSMKANRNTVKVRCPYCGAKSKAKLRPGRVRRFVIWHEPWCPVPTDGEW
jgi:DNA-directed RNA polymerase subunit RPC12/RpoP